MGQIEQVVGLSRDVLGDAVFGIYLHGASVLGGLKATSNLDLLIVTRRRTAEARRRQLIEASPPDLRTWRPERPRSLDQPRDRRAR